MRELNTVTIEVLADEQGKLLNPIKLEEHEILDLGVYECGKLKVWVVKKLPNRIELPNGILPRHADHRDNIVELCKTVNQLIGYIKQMETEA